MLPCSVRRVAATAPQSPMIRSALPRATATHLTCSYRPAQRRRYSSSKPSRDNGSEDSPARQSVQPATETKETKTSEAKASGEKRRRKTKDASDKLKYPSVPTTSHISSDFLALSSFFSLHRPISVTRGLPRNVTDDAFASIFAAPTRGQKAAEVMTTLSRTVETLEQQPLAGLSLQQQQQHRQQQQADAEAAHDEAPAMHMRHADGSESNVSVTMQVQSMSGHFLPFRPPPLPLPESATDGAKHGVEAAAEEEDAATQTRVYKAVFTIEETTDANGEVKIMAHSPELIEEDQSLSSEAADARDASEEALADAQAPRTFLGRMAQRQLRFEDPQARREGMWSISVKRQRKLKMKKKKYKKLTKRLRHERLKHGRT